MKLMWFHLMPYAELFKDFRENNPSVWVDLSQCAELPAFLPKLAAE